MQRRLRNAAFIGDAADRLGAGDLEHRLVADSSLSKEQKELMRLVLETWERAPHLRFCQLVEAVAMAGALSLGDSHCLFYLTDEKFTHCLKES